VTGGVTRTGREGRDVTRRGGTRDAAPPPFVDSIADERGTPLRRAATCPPWAAAGGE
jgi:hypothetical protein